jgi:hypothetical protein
MSEGSNRLPVLATEIQKAHADALAHQRRSLEDAMKAGALLIEAKALVGHGGWLPWLKTTGVPERMAQRYMRLARNKDAFKSDTVSDLGIAAALDTLAAVSQVAAAHGWHCHLGEGDDLDGLWRFPSYQHPGFEYILRIESKPGGGGIRGTPLPVPADMVPYVVVVLLDRDADIPEDDAVAMLHGLAWERFDTCPWAFNKLLYDNPEAWVNSINSPRVLADLAENRPPTYTKVPQ